MFFIVFLFAFLHFHAVRNLLCRHTRAFQVLIRLTNFTSSTGWLVPAAVASLAPGNSQRRWFPLVYCRQLWGGKSAGRQAFVSQSFH